MKILSISHELLYKTDRLTIVIDYKDRMQLTQKLEALSRVDPDAEYDITIEKKRRRRSLDANAYMWVLADKIGEAIGATPKEVYRKAVLEVGVFYYAAIPNEQAAAAIRTWEHNGTGWMAFREPYCKVDGCTKIKFYQGSSVYDTKQMSRLLDYIVEEAAGLGIETETPDEIAKLESEWGNE